MPTPNDPNQPNLPPGTPKVRLEDIMDVNDAEQKLTAIFKNSIKNLESESKEAFSRLSFGIDKVVEKEEKQALSIHKQFLKSTMSADRFHIEELKKQRDELKKQIEDEAVTERNLLIGGLKNKQDREEAYARHKLQTAEKIKKVETSFNKEITQSAITATAKELGFSEAAVSGMLKYATKANVVTGILGGVVAVLSEALSLSRQFAQVQGAVRGAGFSGQLGVGKFGEKTGDVGKIFESLSNATAGLSISQSKIREFIIALSDAPKALKDIDKHGSGDLMKFAASMGDLGVSVSDSIQIVSGASNDLNMSTKRLTEVYRTARGITNATGMNAKQAFNTLLNLSGSLRGLTFNAEEASKVLVATALPLQKLGFSNTEIQKFAGNLAGVLGQLSPSKLAGMMGFVKGRMPTRDELTKQGGLDTMVEYFNEALKGFDKNSAERLYAIEGLAKEVGLTSATTVKGAEGWDDILSQLQDTDPTGRAKILKEYAETMKPTDEKMLQIQKEGFDTLIDLTSPLEQLSTQAGKFFENFSGEFMGIMRNLNRLISSYNKNMSSYSDVKRGVYETGQFAYNNPMAAGAAGIDSYLSTQWGLRLPKNLRPKIRHASGIGYFVPKHIDPREYQ